MLSSDCESVFVDLAQLQTLVLGSQYQPGPGPSADGLGPRLAPNKEADLNFIRQLADHDRDSCKEFKVVRSSVTSFFTITDAIETNIRLISQSN